MVINAKHQEMASFGRVFWISRSIITENNTPKQVKPPLRASLTLVALLVDWLLKGCVESGFFVPLRLDRSPDQR